MPVAESRKGYRIMGIHNSSSCHFENPQRFETDCFDKKNAVFMEAFKTFLFDAL